MNINVSESAQAEFFDESPEDSEDCWGLWRNETFQDLRQKKGA